MRPVSSTAANARNRCSAPRSARSASNSRTSESLSTTQPCSPSASTPRTGPTDTTRRRCRPLTASTPSARGGGAASACGTASNLRGRPASASVREAEGTRPPGVCPRRRSLGWRRRGEAAHCRHQVGRRLERRRRSPRPARMQCDPNQIPDLGLGVSLWPSAGPPWRPVGSARASSPAHRPRTVPGRPASPAGSAHPPA